MYMNLLRKYFKRIAIDAAGCGLLILSVLTGWLPGPGGIPLFLAGLGLLSINNAWAKKLLEYFKTNGQKFLELIFPDNPLIKALHDLLVVILLAGVVIVIVYANNAVAYGVAIVLFALAVVDVLYNRKRLQTLRKNDKQK